MKPRSAFKLKLLAGHVWAREFATLAKPSSRTRQRLLQRAERFYRALAYVASRETHNYKGEPVNRQQRGAA
jgi:hypothetical protein